MSHREHRDRQINKEVEDRREKRERCGLGERKGKEKEQCRERRVWYAIPLPHWKGQC